MIKSAGLAFQIFFFPQKFLVEAVLDLCGSVLAAGVVSMRRQQKLTPFLKEPGSLSSKSSLAPAKAEASSDTVSTTAITHSREAKGCSWHELWPMEQPGFWQELRHVGVPRWNSLFLKDCSMERTHTGAVLEELMLVSWERHPMLEEKSVRREEQQRLSTMN